MALLSVLLGCGQDEKLGRVSGTVRLDNQPLTSGTIQFFPAAGRTAKGEIQSDGTYTLGTLGQTDGATLGTNKVAIVAYEAGGDQRPPYETRNQSNKPLVPERYMSIGTSRLTFEVKPGDNQADFDLQSR